VGACEAGALALVEATLEYHPVQVGRLTGPLYRGSGPYQVGSLTGAVASQIVTEARKGTLKMVGTHLLRVSA
jgi:hypothetical protein